MSARFAFSALVAAGAIAACGAAESNGGSVPGVVDPDGGSVIDGDAPDLTQPDSLAPVEGIVVRPSGKVINVQDGVPCGAGAPAGAICKHVVVQCPGIAELGATIAIVTPAPLASSTVVGFSGGGGDSYYSTGVAELIAKGNVRIVLPKWDGEWEGSIDGVLAAACRPATLISWVFENVHGSSRDSAYCAAGFSGGSGAMSYALAHYGREDVLDFVALAAGPPFGRMDYGCAPATYAGPPRVLCPLLQDAVMSLPPAKIDGWENTTTCGASSPPIEDILKWARDSVVSPGADYDYPKTVVDFFDCTNMPNGTTGGAFFYSSAITSPKSVFCFDGPTDGCSGEALGPGGVATLVSELTAKCVPRH